jgi:hypothetical protein
MTEAVAVRLRVSAVVRVYRCPDFGGCREVLGMNMTERQRELDRQRG